MNGITSTLSKAESLPPGPIRAPLLPRTFSANSTTFKQIRRKTSCALRSDSTDDFASPHASIYEAQYISAANSEDGNEFGQVTLAELMAQDVTSNNDENARGEISIIFNPSQEIQFRYGHGTMLDTITEQRSSTTIRTLARPKSADDIKLPFLNHRDSFILAKSPRRKRSFSANDLDLIKRIYHDACSNIECKVKEPLSIREIYAQPKTPIHAPLPRPTTPPGMPSWTAAQNFPGRPTPYRRPSLHPTATNTENVSLLTRIWRWFALPANEIAFSSRVPISTTGALGYTFRDRPPRFRPVRSSYTSIQQHPFNTAPIARIPAPQLPPPIPVSTMLLPPTNPKKKRGIRNKVRFTPSATARDSEMNTLRGAIEATSSAALSPISPVAEISQNQVASAAPRCPHRKGRRDALNATSSSLNHRNTTPPSNKYVLRPIDTTPFQFTTEESPTEVQTQAQARQPTSPTRPISATSSVIPAGLSPDRPTSVSSTANLVTTSMSMSGALVPPKPKWYMSLLSRPQSLSLSHPHPISRKPKVKPDRCWKCTLGKGCKKLDKWWMDSASCICFVCCGFDIEGEYVGYGMRGSRGGFRSFDGAGDEGGLTGGPRGGDWNRGNGGRWYGDREGEPRAVRRVILERTPPVAV
ncbi:hypothetical protein BGZ60DRAFT_31927 [Tricladium varicosporioides]|nr:hypothetical protein BGZ60DRAFT_31927 [Hymenoscyphus varicosporioides]